MFNTAILFLVFNRPETTSKVFSAIKKHLNLRVCIWLQMDQEKIKKEKKKKVNSVRKIVTDVDWQCDVKTLFREKFGLW